MGRAQPQGRMQDATDIFSTCFIALCLLPTSYTIAINYILSLDTDPICHFLENREQG